MNMNMTEANVTLKGLNEAGIENFTEFIQEVSAQASSEFSLEALLKKVEDSWKEVEFVVIPHKVVSTRYSKSDLSELMLF